MDPYDRPQPNQPDSIFVEGDTDTMKSYNVERLLNKRVIRKGRGYATEYLIRWKGYGPAFNEWYNIKDLKNADKLVAEYEAAMATSASAPPTPATPPDVPPRRRHGRP